MQPEETYERATEILRPEHNPRAWTPNAHSCCIFIGLSRDCITQKSCITQKRLHEAIYVQAHRRRRSVHLLGKAGIISSSGQDVVEGGCIQVWILLLEALNLGDQQQMRTALFLNSLPMITRTVKP